MRSFIFAFLALTALAACGDRVPAPIVPAALDNQKTADVFVATNRARNSEGYFDKGRSFATSFVETTVSFPPGHEPGDAPRYSKNPNPDKHFALASERVFVDQSDFVQGLRRELMTRPPQQREITVFVHGYFNGYADSVFRIAQMHEDFQLNSVPVAFSWPSAAKPAGYTYDRDSVLFSRDALEELLFLLPQTGARNILLVGHSMGSLLITETLRQIEGKRPGWSDSNLAAVVLMSPDISVDVFRQQAASIGKLPEPFVIVASEKDKALRLSKTLSLQEERLGLGENLNLVSDIPIIVLDVSDFSGRRTNPHFVAAESPALISLITSARDLPGYAITNEDTFLGSLAASASTVQDATEYVLSPGQ